MILVKHSNGKEIWQLPQPFNQVEIDWETLEDNSSS